MGSTRILAFTQAFSFHKLSVPPSYVIPAWCVFSEQCTKLTLHCNHRSGHLKTEHTESLFLLRRHLENWPRSKHEKRTAGSAWETWTVAAADGVRCARVRWEINFLLTFETAPFFCVYPVWSSWLSLRITWQPFVRSSWTKTQVGPHPPPCELLVFDTQGDGIWKLP